MFFVMKSGGKMIKMILGLFMLQSSLFSAELDGDLSSFKKSSVNLPTPSVSSDENYSSKDVEIFMEQLSNLFGHRDEAIAESFTKSRAPSSLIYKIDLKPVKDKYLYNGLTFKTTKGSIVYLSITMSSNCPGNKSSCKDSDKFLLSFISNGNASFVPIMDIINVSIFMHGSKTLKIDGDSYTAKVYGNVSNINKSSIEVTGPQGKVINKTLGDVMGMFSNFGVSITLSKKYNVIYGKKVVCNSSCSFSSDNMALMVEEPLTADSSYYVMEENKLGSFTYESIGNQYVFSLNDGIFTVKK